MRFLEDTSAVEQWAARDAVIYAAPMVCIGAERVLGAVKLGGLHMQVLSESNKSNECHSIHAARPADGSMRTENNEDRRGGGKREK